MTNAEQKSFLERQEWLQKQEIAEKDEVKNKERVEARLRELDEKEREIVTRAKQLAEYGQSLVAKENEIQRKVDQKVGELVRMKAKALDEREEKLRKDEASLTKLKVPEIFRTEFPSYRNHFLIVFFSSFSGKFRNQLF